MLNPVTAIMLDRLTPTERKILAEIALSKLSEDELNTAVSQAIEQAKLAPKPERKPRTRKAQNEQQQAKK